MLKVQSQQMNGFFRNAIYPEVAGEATIGTVTNEWGDLYLFDDKVMHFGSDQDVNLSHIQDTGLRLDKQLQFNSGNSYIYGSGTSPLDTLNLVASPSANPVPKVLK